MSELKPRITENGIDYILVGDYYIPDLKLPEEHLSLIHIFVPYAQRPELFQQFPVVHVVKEALDVHVHHIAVF